MAKLGQFFFELLCNPAIGLFCSVGTLVAKFAFFFRSMGTIGELPVLQINFTKYGKVYTQIRIQFVFAVKYTAALIDKTGKKGCIKKDTVHFLTQKVGFLTLSGTL